MTELRMKRPDAKNALSIVAAAERQINFTLALSVTDDSAFNIVRNVYECFRMLGDALLVSQGIASQDHIEQIHALEKVHVKTTRPVGIVDNLRKLRHNINYHGYNPSQAEAMDAISFAQACFRPILNEIKKELRVPLPSAAAIGGRLFLSGGGDEKQTFEIDEIFLQNVNRILYIPVAWKNDDFESCRHWITHAMEQHKRVSIEMHTDLTKRVDLKKYDAVYIGGGNTFKLLKRIRESGFDKALLEYYKTGGTIYGGSAGAIIWGADISMALICDDADVNDVSLQDTRGFNLLHGYDIQCHYRDKQLVEHQAHIEKSGRNIIAIPEESALLVENRAYRVIGTEPITIITETDAKSYTPGATLPLAS